MAIVKEIQLIVDNQDAVESIHEVDGSIQDVTNTTEDLNKELKKTGKVADKSMDKLDKNAKKGSKSVGKLGLSFKRLGTAIKASGVGLVVAAFAAFGSVASQNQSAIDTLSTTMTVVQILFNDLITGGERIKKEGFGFLTTALAEAREFTELLKKAALDRANIARETVAFEIAAEGERQIRDNVLLTFETRIAASERLKIILDEQSKSTLKLANDNLKAAEAAFNLNSTTDNQVKVVEAHTAVLDAQNKVATATSEQLVSNTALIVEQTEAQRANTESIRESSLARDAALAQLEGDEIRTLEVLQIINDRELEQLRLKLIEIAELEGLSDEERLARRIETQAKIDELNINDLSLQRDIAFAKIDLQSDIVSAAANTLGALATIAGQETKFGRALLITKQVAAAAEIAIGISKLQFKASSVVAEAAMDGAKATTSVATGAAVTLSAGFPAAIPLLIGYAVAAAGIVASIIQATKTSKSVAAKFGGTGPSIETPQVPTAPQFNIVGTAPENQLADAIQGQQQQPIEAFVVASNVTTQQALDRNKVETSSFG